MKILVISSNLIGDNILSSGAIEHFSKKFKNAKFTFVTGPTAYQLYDNFPNLEQLIVIKKKKYNFHWCEIFFKCFFNYWDIVIDFRSSLIGYFLINKKKYIFKKNNNYHHIDQLSHLFGFNCSFMKIYTNEKEDQIAKNSLIKNFKYVFIYPGGNWPPKLWPDKNFNKLIKHIDNKYPNVKFIITGSEKEKNMYFENVVSEIDKDSIIDLMGATLTLTAAYMKRSHLFIGNDSGLMHLSVASNLNTIGLFGPTNDKIYSPRGKNSFVVRTKENYEYFAKYINDESKSFMNTIQTEDILSLIKKNNLL